MELGDPIRVESRINEIPNRRVSAWIRQSQLKPNAAVTTELRGNRHRWADFCRRPDGRSAYQRQAFGIRTQGTMMARGSRFWVWVLLWSSLKDVALHWHCKTPRLLIQNFILGTVPDMVGTSAALFTLMERVANWASIQFGSLGMFANGRMWKAMDLPVCERHLSQVTPQKKR